MSVGTSFLVVGGGLQLLGVIIAGDGVRRTRVQYAPERLGAWRQIKKWVGSLGRGFRRQAPVAESTVGAMSADASARAFDARGVVGLGPEATTEQRVDFLMTQVMALQTEVGRLDESLATESREWHEAFATLGAAVSEEAAKTRRRVKESKAEGLAQEAIGLWCVGAGVVLALVGSLMG
ncbi:hypothetical protein ABT063_10580 [Streptomyces sp. NPDC002838]|uniref:hypothetical protein n=1 Tax=Streptomyces sp. NPDC002838 TaxID=3154436 RepID=UPI00332C38B6